jgi:hypothetical protein
MQDANKDRVRKNRLESWPLLERHYVPDETAMLAALRVVLSLPQRPVASQEV